MIGRLNSSERQVTIIGAGFSGLLAAYELDRRGYEVTLYEKESRAGGLIRTLKTENGLVETAAHSFLATQEVRKLCADLGVELISVQSKHKYILRDGKLRRFPLKLGEAIVAFFRAYFVLSNEKSSWGRATLADWGARHFGSGALKYALSPFLTGIYALRPSEVTIGAAFPALQVPRGQSFFSQMIYLWRKGAFQKKDRKKEMMAPVNGMGSLVEAMEKYLMLRLGERFKKGTPVDSIPENTKNLILAVPASVAAQLLKQGDPKLSQALSGVRYSPMIAISMIVENRKFQKVPMGVGVLMPESEKRKVLGVLFDSSSFANRVKDESRFTALTLMLGGSFHPEYLKLDDAELLRIARSELYDLFGLSEGGEGDPEECIVTRWEKAIPRYDAALMDAWEAARKGWCEADGHILFGNYTGQVSLRGMIQSISQI